MANHLLSNEHTYEMVIALCVNFNREKSFQNANGGYFDEKKKPSLQSMLLNHVKRFVLE